MKKLALLALAAPALAGTPAPVVTAAPAPAPAESAWSVEVGASGSFAATELFRHSSAKMPVPGATAVDTSRHMKIDTIGLDMTLVRTITPNHAFTFRIAAADGSEIYDRGYAVYDMGGAPFAMQYRDKASLRTISLMPGYRFTQPIAEKTSLFCGVSAGLVSQDVHVKTMSSFGNGTEAASSWGIGAEAEAGVRYQICPDMDIFAAYQISGNNAHCIIRDGAEVRDGYKTHCQIHHGVRAGVGIKF